MMDNMIQLPEKNWSPLEGLQLVACSSATRAAGTVNPFGATGIALVTSRRRPDLI
jgi:hypothetical protein